MDRSNEEIRQIEEKAKEEQRRAEEAKKVVKDAQKAANPQREHNEFQNK
ncbi:hypothetical protein [Guptibacillus algicola]|nr:hypothetical protein [Alkalihalobacillus algicola]MCA0987876.1 hypothetical protein [Alkalihalobacillus algicola]